MIREKLPLSNSEVRAGLYDGDVFLVAPTEASKKIAKMAYDVLYKELGDNPRRAERELSQEEFFSVMGRVRREIYTSSRFHSVVRECIASLGFDNAHIAFDPARLRIINHDGHLNPLAAAVYYPHRDIWYGHPSSLITWWIPLDDLSQEETFWFYPDRFRELVPNTSEIFDYDQWVSKGWDLKIGWQKVCDEHRLQYPSVIGNPDRGQAVSFSCIRGQNLLFSGAQFHATRPQSFHKTRFSLDFRIVDMRDVRENRGAPIVDDRSTGTALPDYIQPGKVQWETHVTCL